VESPALPGTVKFRTAAEVVPEFVTDADDPGVPVVVVPTVTVAAVPAFPFVPLVPFVPAGPCGPAGSVRERTGFEEVPDSAADPAVPDGTVPTVEDTDSVGEMPLLPFAPLIPLLPLAPAGRVSERIGLEAVPDSAAEPGVPYGTDPTVEETERVGDIPFPPPPPPEASVSSRDTEGLTLTFKSVGATVTLRSGMGHGGRDKDSPF